jgi:7,8-dihydro-6-hydroxymethylpterin-pyrophosphokinase
MQNRKFVLLPASEIAPTWEHPNLMKDISELLEVTSDNSLLEKI